MQPCIKENTIEKIFERVTDLEKCNVRTDELIKQFTKSNDELSATMKCLEKTMISINHSLESNTTEIHKLNKKVDILKSNEEKNKIDMRDIFKASFMKIGVGLISAYGIYELVMKFR
jgi:chromosome segregation ATPase